MGRKDAFPGADGSTIQETGNPNASTIKIYGTDGSILTEGTELGLHFVSVSTDGMLINNNSQIYAIKNPLAFIYGVLPLYDWYAIDESYQNHTLWTNGTKSKYDPCPHGWRVPQDGTWNDYSMQTFQVSGSETNVATGRLYLHTAWYPNTGYRHFRTGILSYIGTFGFYWTDAIYETTVGYFRFEINNIYPSNSNGNRAHGFVVRCVQE